MKRLLLMIGAILLGLMLKAQSVTYTCRYWFDQEFGQATTATFSSTNWQAQLDVGNLTEGLHAVHLQVMDTSMRWSVPMNYLFLKIAQTPSTILDYHYWFDQDHASMQSGPLGSGHLLLDVADLEEGMHTLHVMLKGSEEFYTSYNYLFLKTAAWQQGVPDYVCHCWFDEDFVHRQSNALGNGHLLLNVAGLEEGMHTVHVLLEGGTYTATQSYLFMKEASIAIDEVDMSHLAYHCWFDEDFEHQQIDSVGNGHILLEVSHLEDGLHTVHVMLQGSTYTATQSHLFMKVAVEDPAAEMQYICWFDQDYSSVQTGPLGSGLFELEVGNLPNGIHTVNVQLDNGTRSAPLCYLFYKQPLGGNGIARWEYWLNDDIANRQTTVMSPVLDTLDIVSLLPVGHPALRSSCFHFHPNGDNPYINAKNEITFRFWDNENRLFDKSAFYVDEQVEQDIVATVFERNTTETFAAPHNNQITWYKLDAVVGDSLSFIANKACTMQLFAPSGEEVFNVSGPESIVLGGFHAWEDGTYYLAVHDMMGSGETVSVTYNWIAKYCVLSYNPENVGNRIGNQFVMDLLGNGFNYLENVLLIRNEDTINMKTIVSYSKTTARIQFVILDNVPNGFYDLNLIYRDSEVYDTITYTETFELEEPDSGMKLVTIQAPSPSARPYPIVVTVENTSNMDYVYVPFNIAFTNPLAIEKIDFDNFSATMTHEADSSGYSFAVATTNLLDMHIDGVMMFFGIPYLKAHEKQSFTLKFSAPNGTRFDLYAWVGDGYEYNADFDTLVIPFGNRATPEAQNLLDFGGRAQEFGGHLGNPGDIAGRVGSNAIKTGITLGGIQNALGHIQDKAVCDANGITPDNELYGQIMELHPPIATPGEIIGGPLGELIDGLMGFQRQGCDNPNPNPSTSGHAHFMGAVDPNDIHGYLSESGSHYMRQEIQNVQYEIEFENDTTLATAAAHTIIVRDTLDATKFDLNSLAARSVTIGDKRLELNGEQTFARTLDMRPELYVIAQIEQDYDPTTGIIQWTIQSLDPMTMEPTDNPYQGVLPVNYSGNGVGFIDYSINLKQAFADGTAISNRAGIIFDQEEVIMTPTWTNIIDAEAPTSYIEEVTPMADSLNFVFVSQDNRSGVWYHSLYYRNASTEQEWQVRKAQIFEDSFVLHLEDLLTTEYLVVAVDSAGNREDKDMVAEYIYAASGLHFVTEGNWSTASNWQEGTLPGADDMVFIDVPCQLDQDAEVAALAINNCHTLTVQSGKTLTVNGLLSNTSAENLVIEDGAQLVNASPNVAATVKKDVQAYNNGDAEGWYTIASPMNGMAIEGSGYVTPEYDLYRYNETNLNGEEWENYKANLADFTTFEKGRGYLFANSNSFSPVFIGTLNNTDITCSLTCTNRPNDPLSGFNLIGNPFPHNIYKGSGAAIDNANLASGYYTLTNEGTWQAHTFEDAILPGQGILVKATAPTVLTIAKSNEEAFAESGDAKNGAKRMSISVSGTSGQDRAYVYFVHGNDLNKVEDYTHATPNLAIHTDKGNFAIVHLDKKSDAVELVFTTRDKGSFTMDVNVVAGDFDYLHLIDSLTGDDVDLLATPSYTFEASARDDASRFRLVFSIKGN